MKFRSMIGLLSVLALLPLSLFAGEPYATVPESMNMLGRIDIAGLLKTSRVAELMNEDGSKLADSRQRMLESTGIDLEQVTTAWMMAEKKLPGLLILEGKFDGEAISSALARNPKLEKLSLDGVRFAVRMLDPKGKTRDVAMLNDETLIAGSPKVVEQYLAALKGEGTTYRADTPEIAELVATKGLLAVTALNFDRMAGYRPPINGKPQPNHPMLEQVSGARLTASLDELLSLSIWLEPREAKNLEGLQALLNGVVAGMLKPNFEKQLAAGGDNPDPIIYALVQLLDKTQVKTVDGLVVVSVDADLSMIADALAAQMAKRAMLDLQGKPQQ